MTAPGIGTKSNVEVWAFSTSDIRKHGSSKVKKADAEDLNNFMKLACIPLVNVVAAICLASLVRRGMADQDPVLRYNLIGMSITVALVGLVPFAIPIVFGIGTAIQTFRCIRRGVEVSSEESQENPDSQQNSSTHVPVLEKQDSSHPLLSESMTAQQTADHATLSAIAQSRLEMQATINELTRRRQEGLKERSHARADQRRAVRAIQERLNALDGNSLSVEEKGTEIERLLADLKTCGEDLEKALAAAAAKEGNKVANGNDAQAPANQVVADAQAPANQAVADAQAPAN